MKKIIFIFLFIFFTIICKAEDKTLDITGENSLNTSMFFKDDILFTSYINLTLNLLYKYDNVLGEASLLYNHNYNPINPLINIKEGSKIYFIINNYTNQLISSLDSNSQQFLSQFAQFTNMNNLDYIYYSTLAMNNKFLLDKAYLKLKFQMFDFYIGKQIIAWGTGYAFNPTDIWNQKNPLDPTAPKQSVNAIRMELPMGVYSSLDFVFKLDYNPYHTSEGIRFRSMYRGFDYSFSVIRQNSLDYDLLNIPRKLIGGFDFAGEIKDFGIIGEFAIINPLYSKNWDNFDSLYAQGVLGVSYTTDNEYNIMVELYYNGIGKNNANNYNIDDFFKYYIGDMAGFGKYYSYLGINKQFFYNWNFSINALVNINDKSFAFFPFLSYNLNDNVSIKISPTIFFGDKHKSEFGSYNNSINISTKAYF